jgi:hypothetical protein
MVKKEIFDNTIRKVTTSYASFATILNVELSTYFAASTLMDAIIFAQYQSQKDCKKIFKKEPKNIFLLDESIFKGTKHF